MLGLLDISQALFLRVRLSTRGQARQHQQTTGMAASMAKNKSRGKGSGGGERRAGESEEEESWAGGE